jgi:hypothetical protein
MPNYEVRALKEIRLVTTVEADNQEEAERLADVELITDDFVESGVSFTLLSVIETTKCLGCGESNMTEFADPNAKNMCVFCIEGDE